MVKQEVGPKNFGQWLEESRSVRGVLFKGLDLRAEDWRLAEYGQAEHPGEGCVFIDCKLGPRMRELASLHYGTVYPELPWRAYRAYRSELYTPDELFDRFDAGVADSYKSCLDWRIYVETRKPAGADELVARRLHDHFIGEELREYLAGHPRVVAFMGGHDALRSSGIYRQVAEMARELARAGYLVATGGGPGLMEAANLGAALGPCADKLLDELLSILGVPGGDRYDGPAWLGAGWAARERLGSGGPSLGVPTWFYGHEPPNVFSTVIAKYFENSFREEGLLAIATGGVIFAEGNGGTVQEIFQDACQNYYATYGARSPMILFGTEYWNPAAGADGSYPGKAKPAWPLLRKLAEEKGFLDRVCVTSSAREAVDRILRFGS
jgi:predicted Rossmann-fold nucleotide-binding protein